MLVCWRAAHRDERRNVAGGDLSLNGTDVVALPATLGPDDNQIARKAAMLNKTSFIVGSKYGPRSACWLLSVYGEDVYIRTEKDKRRWKVTLHPSGRWHLKNNRSRSGIDPPIVKSHRNQVPPGIYPVGLFIGIPDECLRHAGLPDERWTPDIWLDRPTLGGLVEVAVMRWHPSDFTEEWFGKSAGTNLFCYYGFPNGSVVGLLSRHLPANHPDVIAGRKSDAAYIARFRRRVLDSPERRGYSAAINKAAAIVLREIAID